MSMYGTFKDCVIAISGQLSAEVDLGRQYDEMLIVMPTITQAAISVQVAEKSGDTAQSLYVTDPASGNNKQIISSLTTGALTWIVPIGGARYIKLYSSVTQAAEETFRVCGRRN